MTPLRRVAAEATRMPRPLPSNPVPIYETILRKIKVMKAVRVPVEDFSKTIKQLETSAKSHQLTWKLNEGKVVHDLEKDKLGLRRHYLLAMSLSCAAIFAAPKVAKAFT